MTEIYFKDMFGRKIAINFHEYRNYKFKISLAKI